MSTRALFSLVAIAAVLFSWSQGVFNQSDLEQGISVNKSSNDDRQYQYYELPNKLKVLLVSDSTTDKSGAALDVYVGSNADPRDRQGLAHFLEHMLFLGTKDFPDVEEYQSYVSTHGGSHNAYTSGLHTNYFFEVSQDKLNGALDRFAPFFINPLFNETYVEREQHAVHSEYQSKLQDDYRRIQYASIQAMNPKHPQAHFSTGSLETLADRDGRPVREDLLAFYKKYYSANIMSLVVIGRESLSELKAMVDQRFSAIPNNNAQVQRTNEPLYTPGTLPLYLQIEPVKDLRQLSFTFALPSLLAEYHAKPSSFLGDLLGHEGQGSLLDVLKEEGLALGLSAGSGRSSLDDSSFHITVTLTDKGLENVDHITALLFQTIELVKNKGLEEWRFDQQAKFSALAFQYQQKGSASNTASHLAGNLHVYAPQDVISGSYLQTNFKPELLTTLLEQLTPNNMLRTLVAKNQQSDKTPFDIEPWFNAPYKISEISSGDIENITKTASNPQLALPDVNPFIPDNIEMLSADDDQVKPVIVKQTEGLTLWHQQNTQFNSPRGNLYLNLRSPVSKDSPRNKILTTILTKVINEQLNTYSYPARLAGLGYDIYPNQRGISIKVSGYSDKQTVLLNTVMKQLTQFSVDDALFTRIKKELKRDIANQRLNKPFQQSISRLREMLITEFFSVEQLLTSIDAVDIEALRDFHGSFFETLDITAFIQGNHSPAEAENLNKILEDNLPSHKTAKVPSAAVYKLNGSYSQEMALAHNDSSFTQYFQGNDKSLHERARFGLMSQVMSSPYYLHMRTKKQLGYVVFATPLPLLEVPGLALIVQSPSAIPSEILAESERFLNAYANTFANMSDTELAEHKQGLINRLNEKPKNLSEAAERIWKDIDINNTQFDTLSRIAEEVNTITRTELEQLLQQMLTRKNSVLVQNTGMQKSDVLPTDYTQQKNLSNLTTFPIE